MSAAYPQDLMIKSSVAAVLPPKDDIKMCKNLPRHFMLQVIHLPFIFMRIAKSHAEISCHLGHDPPIS
jgi:hypothetical protein